MPTPSCPVCATEVHVSATRCARCLAPHHAECWNYNGGCGIYACRGRWLQGGGLLRVDRGEATSRWLAVAFCSCLLVLPIFRELVWLTLTH